MMSRNRKPTAANDDSNNPPEEAMGLIPMMEKGKPKACHANWPLFYMNDFSRLGLVVTRLAEAIAVLEASGYRVLDNGSTLEVDSLEQLTGVFATLSEHRLEYEMSDVVSCVYQG
jgi:hypothetical protein